MSFKKYKGTDKYHFRVYKRNGQHPFVVVMITKKNGKWAFFCKWIYDYARFNKNTRVSKIVCKTS